MDSPETNERVDLELQRLEKRLDELVTICRQLQEENQSLKERQDMLTEDRHPVAKK